MSVGRILFNIFSVITVLLGLALFFRSNNAYCANVQNAIQAADKNYANIETVSSFTDIVPRSIAVSADSRIFLCCPRGHKIEEPTLVEIKDGKPIPFPDVETNKIDIDHPVQCFISAMAAVVDDSNHLWVLDNGRKGRTLIYGGAKLVGIDLSTNRIFKTILLKNYVLSPDIVLYDLEIDPTRGKAGTALITASGSLAPGTMIVSDLDSGHTMRRLHQHSSVRPDEHSIVFVEGEMVKVRKNNDNQNDWLPGVFGLTVNGERNRLYYSAVASQDIYSVDLNKLCDPDATNKEVENTIRHIDYKVALGTGIECDKQNRIYLSDIEHNAIWRRHPDGQIDIVARSPKLCYSDHLFIANDGYLYVTASQYKHNSRFYFGENERTPPFEVLRIFVNTTSATLCSHTF